VVVSEHDRLKEIFWYGRILKKRSLLRFVFKKIGVYLKNFCIRIRYTRFVKNVKRIRVSKKKNRKVKSYVI